MFHRNKILAASIFFSVIFLSIAVLIIGRLVYSIEDIGSRLEGQRLDILALDERIAEAKAFSAFRSQSESEFAKLEKVLVDEKMPLEFINFLEDVSRDCQVDSSITTASPTKSASDVLPSINFQVSLAGDFSAAMKYLRKIESGPYLVEIRSLEIKNGEGAGLINGGEAELKAVKMGISIKAYAKEIKP